MEITFKRYYEQLTIYVNGILHLRIKLMDLVGIQTWVHGEREYFIEYYFSTRDKITTVYSSADMWKKILAIIDDNTTNEVIKK